jgi:hypothetical protein
MKVVVISLIRGTPISCVVVITKVEGASKTPTYHNPIKFGGVASLGASPPKKVELMRISLCYPLGYCV